MLRLLQENASILDVALAFVKAHTIMVALGGTVLLLLCVARPRVAAAHTQYKYARPLPQ